MPPTTLAICPFGKCRLHHTSATANETSMKEATLCFIQPVPHTSEAAAGLPEFASVPGGNCSSAWLQSNSRTVCANISCKGAQARSITARPEANHTPLAAARHISDAPEMPLTTMKAGLSATVLPYAAPATSKTQREHAHAIMLTAARPTQAVMIKQDQPGWQLQAAAKKAACTNCNIISYYGLEQQLANGRVQVPACSSWGCTRL